METNMNQKTKKITVLVQFIISVAFLTGLDQWTKYLAVQHLKDQADIPLIPNVLYLHYLENRGAAFGLFHWDHDSPHFVCRTLCTLAHALRKEIPVTSYHLFYHLCRSDRQLH